MSDKCMYAIKDNKGDYLVFTYKMFNGKRLGPEEVIVTKVAHLAESTLFQNFADALDAYKGYVRVRIFGSILLMMKLIKTS